MFLGPSDETANRQHMSRTQEIGLEVTEGLKEEKQAVEGWKQGSERSRWPKVGRCEMRAQGPEADRPERRSQRCHFLAV